VARGSARTLRAAPEAVKGWPDHPGFEDGGHLVPGPALLEGEGGLVLARHSVSSVSSATARRANASSS
jgi:hypothetical protein